MYICLLHLLFGSSHHIVLLLFPKFYIYIFFFNFSYYSHYHMYFFLLFDNHFFKFNICFLNSLNFFPCCGLLIKSPNISSVGQYSIFMFPFFTWSVRKKYLIFKCLVLLLELSSHFVPIILCFYYLEIIYSY